MRKFLLSTCLALFVLGSVALASADARPWRRGWYGGYYGSYYAPAYSYYSAPVTVYSPGTYVAPGYEYSYAPDTSYYSPGYSSYYTPGYSSSYYAPSYYARPSVGVWIGGGRGWRWRR
jgi:hypothetical protein